MLYNEKLGGPTVISAISNSTFDIGSAFLGHFYGDGRFPESLEDSEIIYPKAYGSTPQNGGV